MDYPPSATIPVYNNKVYVKVLRIPKNVKVHFKNEEIYESKVSSSHKLIDTESNGNYSNGHKSEVRRGTNLMDNNNANLLNTDFSALGNNFSSSGSNPSNPSNQSNQSNNGNRSSISPDKNTARFNSSGGTNRSSINNNGNLNIPKPHTVITKSSDRKVESKEKEKSLNRSSNNIHLINTEETLKKSGFGIENIDFNELGSKLQDNTNEHGFDFVMGNENIPTTNQKNNNNISQGIFDAFGGASISGGTNNLKSSTISSPPSKNSRTSSNINMTGLDDLDWNNTKNSNTNVNTNTQFSNANPSAFNSKSNYPIDNIPTSLDEDTLKEKVDLVIKVRNKLINLFRNGRWE